MIIDGFKIEPEADLTRAKLSGANLKEADLTRANLTRANLTEANLTEANLSGANLKGADLTGANLVSADLYNAKLTGADLTGANLTGANLTGANLTRANLTGANLTGANLTGANLTVTDLTVTDLTVANLKGVKGLVTPEMEIQIVQWISEEIISQYLLEQGNWHSEDFSWEACNFCSTTHCAAGSAQVWAHLNQVSLPGGGDPSKVEPVIAGSALVPSLAPYFYSDNDKMIRVIDEILSGKRSLLAR